MSYRMYISDGEGPVLFPITPSKLTVKINNQNKTVTLIDGGEVNQIKAPGLTDIKIDELIFPMCQKYPFATYINRLSGVQQASQTWRNQFLGLKIPTSLFDNKFREAKFYLEKLEKWKNATAPVSFILTRTTPDGKKLLFDTNMSVTIESYEIVEDADKYGMDVVVKLDMKQYRTWGAKKLVITKPTEQTTTVQTTPAPVQTTTKKTSKTYTVKKGDCLYNIAKVQLGKASRWTEIYNLNKSTIESTAQKYGRKSSSNGHWIYPGTILILPD